MKHSLLSALLTLNTLLDQAQSKDFRPVQGGTAPAGTERRIALVMGNKDYLRGKLQNPINDADDMTLALQSLGFETITLCNATHPQLITGLNRFKEKLTSSDVALVYYSGHWVSYGCKNYLLPIDADIRCVDQVEEYGIALNHILADITARQVRNSFVFLDACRNLPDLQVCDKTSKDLTANNGLVKPTNNPRGSMVVFATREGFTADDNVTGRNGLFTEALLRYLTQPDWGIRTILDKTAEDVETKSGGRQWPGRYDELRGDFVFVKKPDSPLLPPAVAKVVRTEPAGFVATADLPFGPAMVFVEGGTFMMGSNEGEADEKPVHEVTLSSFRMARTETTVAQYRQYCEEIQAKMPEQPVAGEHHPIVYVSWSDAQGYCKWLSKKTGFSYRLPKEAEWEYAARGGKLSKGYRYAGSNYPNIISWNKDNSDGKTHPVGEKQANELGLFDLSGNVWEWCHDWYGSYSSGGQTNTTGPTPIYFASYRVLHGGNWYRLPLSCRSANRLPDFPSDHDSDIGFRVVSQVQ